VGFPSWGTRYREPHIGPLTERFLTEEPASAEIVDAVRGVLRRRIQGEECIVFEVFDLRLDFDTRTAAVEDELEPDSNPARGNGSRSTISPC
jgi:hypothetical protein